MGAPVGNQNAVKARIWTEAIKRAVARRYNGDLNHGLDKLADEFVESVAKGDLASYKEFGDRLEGKAAQTTDMTLDAGAGLLGILAGLGKSKDS